MTNRAAVIDEARKTMKKCQVGVPRRADAYDDLHGILAECYGTIGRLVNMVDGEYICQCGIRVTPHQCRTGEEF